MFDLSDFAFRHYAETDSTNAEAKRLIAAGALVRPTVLHADLQTAGRGSNGRSWFSRTGNVQASYVLPVDRVGQETLLAVYPLALATWRVIRGIVADTHRVTLKWPNDVLVDGRKVSGTLNEVEVVSGQTYLIVGIGINLVWSPDVSDGIYPPATLGQFGADVPTPPVVVSRLATAILDELRMWLADGFDRVRSRYEMHAHGLNECVVLRPRRTGADPVEGVYAGIDAGGAMLLDGEQGRTRHYSVDVFPSMERLHAVEDGDRAMP